MQASGLITFGSHTRRHTRLREELAPAIMADEVVTSKEILSQQLRHPVDLFCYPNGDSSPAAEALVKSHYLGAVTTQRGWNSRRSDPFRLRRIAVHQDITADKTALLARLSGWL